MNSAIELLDGHIIFFYIGRKPIIRKKVSKRIKNTSRINPQKYQTKIKKKINKDSNSITVGSKRAQHATFIYSLRDHEWGTKVSNDPRCSSFLQKRHSLSSLLWPGLFGQAEFKECLLGEFGVPFGHVCLVEFLTKIPGSRIFIEILPNKRGLINACLPYFQNVRIQNARALLFVSVSGKNCLG